MRIGIFSDTYPPYINGVSTVVETTKRALEKAGHRVFIVTVNPEGRSIKEEENGTVIRLPGIPTGLYDYRLTGIYPFPAINKIRKWNLDVIHSHTEFGVGTFARVFAKQMDIPIVHTYHTMYEDYIHYITKGYFMGPSKKIVEYLTKFYCDKTITELIVLSQKSYELFKEKYKINRNIYIIPTAIEVEKFHRERFNPKEIATLREQYGLKEDDFVILYVGRIAKEKSIDLLITAQASLSKKYPHCKLLIIGDGPDSDKLKSRVSKLKLDGKIIFTGKVPWAEVSKYYQLGTVFATASRTETQGLTILEGMASSLPVVAVNDSSFQGVVIPDLNGYLFNNRKEYLKYVELIINDTEKLAQLTKQARLTSDSHGTKHYASKLINVYENAIRKNGKIKTTFWGRFFKKLRIQR